MTPDIHMPSLMIDNGAVSKTGKLEFRRMPPLPTFQRLY